MVDTERTKAELLTIFADLQGVNDITEQDMRDYVVSADVVNTRFSTGLIIGGIVTASGTTAVDISAGEGFFADNHTDPQNPVRLKVSWSTFSAVAITDILTTPATFFGLDLSSGTAMVVQRAQPFTAEERRDFISLAPVAHSTGVIDSIGATYRYALDEGQSLGDLTDAIGGINLGGGNVYSANGANLQINKSAGSTFFLGDNYQISQKAPNNTTDPVQIPVLAFFYTYQDGGTGFINTPFTNVIDPNSWDDGTGTLNDTVPPSAKFTIHRIWFFPLLNIAAIHYPQATYGTIGAAQAAINTELFNKNPLLISGFRSWLIVEQGVTDLAAAVAADPPTAQFISAGKFGDVFRE